MPVKPILLKNSDEILKNIEHHFKVVAGPGAGKTRWLSNHIKNVMGKSERLSKCRKIACITYTNVGADTIIKRLGDSIDKVEVSTIHSFLYKHVIKPYIFLIKDEFGLDPAKIDGHDELIPSSGIIQQWKKKTSQQYLSDIKAVIKALCDLCWKFSDNKEEIELKFTYIWSGKVASYNIKGNSLIEYKKIFWERNQLHHDDVLYFSYTLLRRFPDILRIMRSKFPYFFVDEFQDTNPIQTEIIKMLAKKEIIVGVIGDKAQSIYAFQGADVKQFEEFELPDMLTYKIENNHRSTEEILSVLNFIRKDIAQHSPDNKHGQKPSILIGAALNSFKKVKEIVGSDNVCTLSYANVTSCEMKNEYAGAGGADLLVELLSVDTSERGKIVASLIKGIEYARQNKFKDAIKQVSRNFKEADEFKGHKTALKLLHAMLARYNSYSNGNLFDFYTTLRAVELIEIAKISISKKTAINTFYEKTTYKEIIMWVKYNDDDSLHRTIHKAKGDEFANVLVIIKDKNNQEFNEEKELSFLLTPDLEKEEQRVFYVALSRAKERLFVNIPVLSDENRIKLEEMGFNVEIL
ncbi:ATP-dependent helicase [Candidatus Desantisbacteria bacterium]|nr:ATP-dependent helicase [Candidatus Desantisbacteria bacterium]